MVIKREETSSKDLGNGMARRVLNHGGKLMLVEFTFAKDGVGAIHAHPHEQIGYIAAGSGVFTIDGKETEVKKGDSMYIPPNTPHGFKSNEDNTIMVDVFTPQREDFFK